MMNEPQKTPSFSWAHVAKIFKPSWYVEQMRGWALPSYLLLMFGFGFLISQTIANPITGMAIWTLAAALQQLFSKVWKSQVHSLYQHL